MNNKDILLLILIMFLNINTKINISNDIDTKIARIVTNKIMKSLGDNLLIPCHE